MGSGPNFDSQAKFGPDPIFFPLAFLPRASEACGTRPSCICGLEQSSAFSLRPRPVSPRRDGAPCVATERLAAFEVGLRRLVHPTSSQCALSDLKAGFCGRKVLRQREDDDGRYTVAVCEPLTVD